MKNLSKKSGEKRRLRPFGKTESYFLAVFGACCGRALRVAS
jgi:hypothetical protein